MVSNRGLPRSFRRAVRRSLQAAVQRQGWRLTPAEDEPETIDPYLQQRYDPTVALPPGAAEVLRPDHPGLVELRRTYAELDWPVTSPSLWSDEVVSTWLDMRWFRGDNPYVWHYRESERVSQLMYFTFLTCILERDPHDLVARLGEDGAFGCWTYRYPGYPPCSRDLLDSVNEIYFLDRAFGLLQRPKVSVLDIGAGYGRLAHRFSQAVPTLTDYVAVDAVAESTYLCSYYCAFREVSPPVEVLPLPAVPGLRPGRFDLAVNVHGFSEMPAAAVRWWLEQIVRLQVPNLFIVPNEEVGFLTLEQDQTRVSYLPLLEEAGYRLDAEEPSLTDPAVRELVRVHDRFCLFTRR
jgi:hypothetical protein